MTHPDSATKPLPGVHLVRFGLNRDGSAWVTVGERPSSTEYRVEPREKLPEYGPVDYEVTLVCGPDVLAHDKVRRWAHDAFLDAFGGR